MNQAELPLCIARHFVGNKILCRHPNVHAPGNVVPGEQCRVCVHINEPAALKSLSAIAVEGEEIAKAAAPRGQPLRGLGDRVAGFTKALGIEPCDGCTRRQQVLNRWFPSHWARQMAKVTLGITAFERPRHLERLVASIRRFYPAARILVADNGRQKAALSDAAAGQPIEVLDLPFDCGLSAARQALVERLTTPYFLLLEEDFVFTAETKIEPLVDILDHDAELGSVGGSVRVNGAVHQYAVDLRRFRGALEGSATRGPLRFSPGGVPYRMCDLHNNFGLWRREMLYQPDHSWDGLPKVGEHAAYFWRVKLAARWRVAHAPTVVVDHDLSGRNDHYKRHRSRAGKLQNNWFSAHGMPGGYKQGPSLAVSPNLLAPPERPNLLVLGVGHSGTSILVKMLFAAGWHAGDADAEFGESVSIRALNDGAGSEGKLNAIRAAAALRGLVEPWAIKDPRFVHTLPAWLPHFAAQERPPLLVWLRREPRQVAASYVKRSELAAEKSLGVVQHRLSRCQALFELWPWAKLALDYERLADAARLFKKV